MPNATLFARLKGQRVVITAGPTREYLDPVRYLSNASSGQMGVALALEAHRRGANVTVVLGPVESSWKERLIRRGIRVISVVSADDMFRVVKKLRRQCSVFVAAAAVSDYRPAQASKHKVKRDGKVATLVLLPNPDIVAWVALPGKDRPQQVIGFALETQQLERQAREKMLRKHLDWIVANPSSNIGQSVGNAIVFNRQQMRYALSSRSKDQLARALWALWWPK